MSIPVPLDALPDALGTRGFGYLITVADDGRSKVLALVPEVRDGELWFEVGSGGTAANARARPEVTVVFPPTADDEFSLIVDGHSTLHGERLAVVPTWAVRHRPAP